MVRVYAEQRLTRPGCHLPAGTTFKFWFCANEPALRQDFTCRDRNVIVATQLLPVFEQEPRGWEALAFLSPALNPNQSLAQRLMNWHSRCPRTFQRFVVKVAAVFGVEV